MFQTTKTVNRAISTVTIVFEAEIDEENNDDGSWDPRLEHNPADMAQYLSDLLLGINSLRENLNTPYQIKSIEVDSDKPYEAPTIPDPMPEDPGNFPMPPTIPDPIPNGGWFRSPEAAEKFRIWNSDQSAMPTGDTNAGAVDLIKGDEWPLPSRSESKAMHPASSQTEEGLAIVTPITPLTSVAPEGQSPAINIIDYKNTSGVGSAIDADMSFPPSSEAPTLSPPANTHVTPSPENYFYIEVICPACGPGWYHVIEFDILPDQFDANGNQLVVMPEHTCYSSIIVGVDEVAAQEVKDHGLTPSSNHVQHFLSQLYHNADEKIYDPRKAMANEEHSFKPELNIVRDEE